MLQPFCYFESNITLHVHVFYINLLSIPVAEDIYDKNKLRDFLIGINTINLKWPVRYDQVQQCNLYCSIFLSGNFLLSDLM